MNRRLSLISGVALALVPDTGRGGITLALGAPAASAEASGETALADQFFRADWRVKDDANGHARLSGYLYNDYGEAADQVQLRITGLDTARDPVATYVEPIGDTVPGFDRVYFDVMVPGHAASNRVAVNSFNWVGGRIESDVPGDPSAGQRERNHGMKTVAEVVPVASADEGIAPGRDPRLKRDCLIRVESAEEVRSASPASARLPGARPGTSRDVRRLGRVNIDEEQRQALRYPFDLPVEIGAASGRTRDFSASGVFFETDRVLAPGAAIRFSVMLGRISPRVPLRLHCEGRVVRIEPRTGCLGVGVAITRCH